MKKTVINILKYIWIGAIFVFVAVYLYKKHSQIANIIKFIPPLNIFMAVSALIVAKIVLSYVSLLSTRYFSSNITFREMLKIYNITQMAKYIPGSIWHFVGKAGFYAEKELSSADIKKSIFVEMAWVIFSASALGIIFLFTAEKCDFQIIYLNMLKYSYLYALGIIIAATLLFIFRRHFKDMIKIVSKSPLINFKLTISLLIVWVLLGWCFFITLQPYMKTSNLSVFLYIVGLYALSYSAGFLVPFAPAGIGIRETILVIGTSSFLSHDKAIVLASLNRVIYIVVEIIVVCALLPLFNRKKADIPKTITEEHS